MTERMSFLLFTIKFMRPIKCKPGILSSVAVMVFFCYCSVTFSTLCAPTTAAYPACSLVNKGINKEHEAHTKNIRTLPAYLTSSNFLVRSYWAGGNLAPQEKQQSRKPRNEKQTKKVAKKQTRSSHVRTLGESNLPGHVCRRLSRYSAVLVFLLPPLGHKPPHSLG